MCPGGPCFRFEGSFGPIDTSTTSVTLGTRRCGGEFPSSMLVGWKVGFICAIGSIHSHYFHIIGDGYQPNSRGLYTHYKDSLLKVG